MRLLCQLLRMILETPRFSQASIYPFSKVENNPFCQALIAQRIEDGLADKAPILADICTTKLDSQVDGLIGGFPCQGVSRAGCQLGMGDMRSALIEHVWRLFDEQPAPPTL